MTLTLQVLAELARERRELGEAERLQARAGGVAMEVLGPDHPEVATYLKSWADVLKQLGRREEARELQARAQTLFAAGSARGASLVDVGQLQRKSRG